MIVLRLAGGQISSIQYFESMNRMTGHDLGPNRTNRMVRGSTHRVRFAATGRLSLVNRFRYTTRLKSPAQVVKVMEARIRGA